MIKQDRERDYFEQNVCAVLRGFVWADVLLVYYGPPGADARCAMCRSDLDGFQTASTRVAGASALKRDCQTP